MGSKSGSSVVGYRYYMTILMGIGRGPVDQLFQIVAGGQVAWDGPLAATSFGVPIVQPDLFGGDQGEGGIDGYFNLYMGDKDQAIPVAFANIKGGGLTPAMRGVTTLMFDGKVCSGNPYPKEFKFRVRRVLKGWDNDTPWYPERAVIKLSDPAIGTYTTAPLYTGDGTQTTYFNSDNSTYTQVVTYNSGFATATTYQIGTGTLVDTSVPAWYNDIYAMNGAHIIYECCTNRDWGRGMDPSLIDNISFTSAANTLYAENFGLCIKWSRQDDVDTFVQSIIDHIGAVLYTDKTTGLLCLRLIRDDYIVSQLPVFDYAHGLLSIESTDSGSQDSTPNEVIVQYHSPVLNADTQARAQNIALINSLGCVFSTTKQYPGLPTSELAQRVAQRDLMAMSSGMKRVSLKVDRRGYLIVPGDVIVVNAPDKKLPNTVLRIAQVEDSSLTDGTITLTATQDVFAPPAQPFVNQEPSAWLAPNRYPAQVTDFFLNEATQRDLEKLLPDDPITTSQTDGVLVIGAHAPTSLSLNFDIWSAVTSMAMPADLTETASGVPFILHGTLENTIGTTDTVITVSGLTADQVPVGSALFLRNVRVRTAPFLATFDEEFVVVNAVQVDAATANLIITVGRGCVDTPAVLHMAGSRVWAYDELSSNDSIQMPKNTGLTFRLLDHTLMGTFPLERAYTNYFVTPYYAPRHARPYPGANFRLNGYPRDATPATGPDLAFTWNHRDRLTQADKLIDETAANIGPETGVYYQVIIYDLNPPSMLPTTGTGRYGYYTDGFNTFTWGAASPGASITTDDHLTITAAQMAAFGAQSGPKRAKLITFVPYEGPNNPYPLPNGAFNDVSIEFYYLATEGETVPLPATPPTSGWGVNFGSNFGAP